MSLTIAQEAEYVGKDRWKWAVWIDGPDDELAQVDSVAWQLHPTFPKPLRWANDRGNRFRLEATGWGMFEIRATLYNERGQPSGPLRHMLRFERPDQTQAPMRGAPEEQRPRRAFISASLSSAGVVQQLRKGLEEQGYEVTDSNLAAEPGQDWQASVEKAISQSDALLAVVGEGSLSSFLEHEIQLAEAQDKPVIPIVVGNQSLPESLSRHAEFRVKDERELPGVSGMIAGRLR